MSATHGWLGHVARNCRLTRSGGPLALSSLIVVRQFLPRTTPCRPSERIRRSTEQCRQILLATQLAPELAGTVNMELLLVNPPDRLRVPCARSRSTRRSATEHENRLDLVLGPVFVDERHHYFGRRLSSAGVKKADALRRFSFPLFSSRFSRSSSLSRSRSELERLPRLPWSRSD